MAPRTLPIPIPTFKEPSEKLVFAQLSAQLPDDYTVLYGCNWSSPAANGGQDVECDFIVARPGGGILVLEVKGGLWERRDGRWYANGTLVSEKDDPFQQAKGNKYALLSLLKRSSNWDNVYFPLVHAVALPDSIFGSQSDAIDLPPVLSHTELRYIQEWIESVMAECVQGSRGESVSQAMLDHLVQSVLPDRTVRLRDILARDDDQLLVLTEQQASLDRALTKKRTLTVQGCAGAGKTLMAIRQVRRLASLPTVGKVLLTCYNLELGAWLADMTKDIRGKCDALPFLTLCEQHARRSGLSLPAPSDEPAYFRQLPDSMLEALARNPLTYDAIVVDEGQEFKEEYWALLDMLLGDPERSYFYIFYDENQRIYDEVQNKVPGDEDPFVLSINVRNTAAIHRQAMIFLPDGAASEACGVPGQPVEIARYSGARSLAKLLKKAFHTTIVQGGVSAKDIILLTGRSAERSILQTLETTKALSPYRLSRHEDPDPSVIRYTSILKFRGMERRVVILTDLRDMDLDSINYLGASRARTKLFVLVSDDVCEGGFDKLANGCRPFK